METDNRVVCARQASVDLNGHVAIITGGARGIGEAVTRLFAAQGAHVVVADLLDEAGYALAAELGDGVSYQHLDVTDEVGWQALVSGTIEQYGRVNALVNSAGILMRDSITSFDLAKFQKVLAVNLIGTFLAIKHVGAAMVKNRGGSIVNVSSIEGLHGSSQMAAYASSKWAVRGLTKVAAAELGDSGIRVNSIHPGPVNTQMVNPTGLPITDMEPIGLLKLMPIKRIADPLEAAQLCLYLVSDASSFMTGAELTIDGGLTATRRY